MHRPASASITSPATSRNRDIACCTSSRRSTPRTYWVPNGVDVEHFSRPATPAAALGAFPHPILGFVGGLSEWVDVELVDAIAEARPAWSLVLIGPIGTPVRTLERRSN